MLQRWDHDEISKHLADEGAWRGLLPSRSILPDFYPLTGYQIKSFLPATSQSGSHPPSRSPSASLSSLVLTYFHFACHLVCNRPPRCSQRTNHLVKIWLDHSRAFTSLQNSILGSWFAVFLPADQQLVYFTARKLEVRIKRQERRRRQLPCLMCPTTGSRALASICVVYQVTVCCRGQHSGSTVILSLVKNFHVSKISTGVC